MSRMGFNPCPFKSILETSAVDQLSHLDYYLAHDYYFFVTAEKSLLAYIIRFGSLCIAVSLMVLKCILVMSRS